MQDIFNKLTPGQATAIAGVVGGSCLIIGAGINSIFAWIFAAWKNRIESKREYRRLAIEAGLENWRHQNLLKIDLMKSGARGDVQIEPPDLYITHMLRVLNMATDMKLSPSEAADKITLWSRGQITSDGKPRNQPPQETPNE